MNARRPLVLAALAGSLTSAASAQTWNNPAGGLWNVAANWSPAGVPGASSDPTIGIAGTYDVILNVSGSVHSLTLQNPTARLLVDNNTDFNVLTGGLTNGGTIIINSDQSGFDRLVFQASATLAGSGVLALNANASDYNTAQLNVGTGFTATVGPNQTIRGNGNMYGSFSNQGTVSGGTIRGPQLRGFMQQNGGRWSVNTAGENASILDGTLVGGTIETSSGGVVFGRGNGNIQSVTITSGSLFSVDNNDDFGINGAGITNNGTLLVNSDQSAFDRLVIRSNATIGGSGVISLNANASDYNTAQLNVASGFTGTIDSAQTISGNGNMYGSFVNRGTVAGGSIRGPQLRGFMQQSGAGRWSVNISGFNASILDGTLAGGTIETSNGGVVFGRGSGNLQGVTITSGSLFSVDNNDDFGVNGTGAIINGTLLINSDQSAFDRLVVRSNATLAGSGVITLNATSSDYNTAQFNVASGFTGTIGPSLTVQGNGNMYGVFTNQGTVAGGSIRGPQLRGFMQQDGGRWSVSGAGQNASILDGTLSGGTIETSSGGRVYGRGSGNIQNLTITTGSVFSVDNNDDFGIGGNGLTNNGAIVINSDQSAFDRLVFRAETAISGTGSIFLGANGSDLNTAQLNTAGSVFGTIGTGQSLRGRGNMYGNFLIDGRIAPGVPSGSVIGGGRTDVLRANSGTLIFNPGSGMDVELASASLWDSLQGNSPKTILAGAGMTVSFLNGFVPPGPSSFDVVIAAGSTITGKFDSLTAPSVPSGPMHLVYFSDRVRLVTCYANCDGSTTSPVLNVNDFSCFLNQFAAGDPYANCDGSTTTPVLNVNDFNCFLNKFAAGCP